jgi:hypothetical protein
MYILLFNIIDSIWVQIFVNNCFHVFIPLEIKLNLMLDHNTQLDLSDNNPLPKKFNYLLHLGQIA